MTIQCVPVAILQIYNTRIAGYSESSAVIRSVVTCNGRQSIVIQRYFCALGTRTRRVIGRRDPEGQCEVRQENQDENVANLSIWIYDNLSKLAVNIMFFRFTVI